MQHRLKYLLVSAAALLFCSIIVPAQKLPSLPMDKAVQRGLLGSGVTYYMVTDPSVKGYAQMAVIQRNDPLSQEKREALSSAFLSRMGVLPGPRGFVEQQDSSTVYRFSDVPIYNAEVLDSMLLYSFAQMMPCKAPQAIVVSGDIDAVELKKKMDIFSMLVPRYSGSMEKSSSEEWHSNPAPQIEVLKGSPATICVTYSSARIPAAQMNTAQALVTDIFGAEFLQLLKHRVQRSFMEAGIPCSEISFSSLRSADYGGDERYSVQLTVAPDKVEEALQLLARLLGEVDGKGAATGEFMDMKSVLSPTILRGTQVSWVNRCISHFLYGANLAPASARVRLFSRKNLADTTETRFFNQFAQALLEPLDNLTLQVQSPDTLDSDKLLFDYHLNYLYGYIDAEKKDYAWCRADTVGLEVEAPKVRIKAEKPEPVTGGTLWTFTNGMRVIFKPVKSSGLFSYALLLNGGLAQMGKLQEGEGGYMGDLLSLYDVGGYPAWAFRDMLEGNGIGMEASVDLNSMTVQGDAPKDKLSLVLKSLLGVANDRSFNTAAFDYYSCSESLKEPSVQDEMDHMLSPGFAYSTRKRPGTLSEDSWKKADKYFEDRFCRMNDGILILSGDLEEGVAKRLLSRYLGGFRVLRGGASRKLVEYRPYSGTSTITAKEGPRGVYVLMDAAYTFSAESFYVAQVAAQALRRALVTHLNPLGFTAQVEVSYMVQPHERYRLFISCQSLSPEHVPADVSGPDVYSAVTAVRAAVREAASAMVKDKDLKAWKALVLSGTEKTMATPDGFVETLLARYANNKDITSRYKESISAITAKQVSDFLGALSNGGRIEYLIP